MTAAIDLVLARLVVRAGDFSLALDAEIRQPVTAVCGPSGAGKTTLLESIAGLRRPAAGRITLAGELLDDGARGIHRPVPQRRIGYVPQDLALFPHLTARGNLEFARAARSRPPTEPSAAPQPDDVVRALELGGLLERRVQQLSGGERQRVALGRALLSAPRLLLLDEPLSGLDTALRERVLEYLRTVRDAFGVPMLYVTHDAGDAAALAAEILVLENGRLADQGAVSELLEPDPGAVRLRRRPPRS